MLENHIVIDTPNNSEISPGELVRASVVANEMRRRVAEEIRLNGDIDTSDIEQMLDDD